MVAVAEAYLPARKAAPVEKVDMVSTVADRKVQRAASMAKRVEEKAEAAEKVASTVEKTEAAEKVASTVVVLGHGK